MKKLLEIIYTKETIQGVFIGLAVIAIPAICVFIYRRIKNCLNSKKNDPHLKLSSKIEYRCVFKKLVNNPETYIYDANVVLKISNSGKESIKYCSFSVYVRPPYSISRYGLDDNQNENYGFPKKKSTPNSKWTVFEATADDVIHPNSDRDIASITIKVKPCQTVQDLIIEYKLAAENIPLIEDQYYLSGNEIKKELFRQAQVRISE